MRKLPDFLQRLFTNDGWLFFLSNLLLWSAFLTISIAVLRYVSRRVDSRFAKTYRLFAAILLATGLAYLLDSISLWWPAYQLSAVVRLIAGIISWVTVVHLIRFIPTAEALRTHAELEKEVRERQKFEEELRVINRHLNTAQEIARIGHWEWDVASNKVVWSPGLYQVYGLAQGTQLSYETYLEQIHPDDRTFVSNNIQQAFVEKAFPDFTHRIITASGEEKVIHSRGEVITDGNGEVIKMIGTGQDITEQQRIQQKTLERTRELETTNAELQKFAFVASHDLQEPLRKITTFASLLEKEAAGSQLESGKVYIDKIVQSATRMQRLIEDILQFSSLKAAKEDYKRTDLNAVIAQVLSDMEDKLLAGATAISTDQLPVIEAIPSQMEQLFLNLLSNAIKFRRENAPSRVAIRSKLLKAADLTSYHWIDKANVSQPGYSYNWTREQFLEIRIIDNGIGFGEEHAEKIFEIFQRLHGSSIYQGTGIGLAICKKIVDNHHGMISAKGQPGEGATFTIILPVSQKNFFVE
jgi:PAS domain S-box-containing protein